MVVELVETTLLRRLRGRCGGHPQRGDGVTKCDRRGSDTSLMSFVFDMKSKGSQNSLSPLYKIMEKKDGS